MVEQTFKRSLKVVWDVSVCNYVQSTIQVWFLEPPTSEQRRGKSLRIFARKPWTCFLHQGVRGGEGEGNANLCPHQKALDGLCGPTIWFSLLHGLLPVNAPLFYHPRVPRIPQWHNTGCNTQYKLCSTMHWNSTLCCMCALLQCRMQHSVTQCSFTKGTCHVLTAFMAAHCTLHALVSKKMM